MTKNIDVVKAFANGDSHPKTTNLKIEGDRLINYYTVLAERVLQGSEYVFIINNTKYSNSTSRIQHGIRMTIDKDTVIAELDNAPMGIRSLSSVLKEVK